MDGFGSEAEDRLRWLRTSGAAGTGVDEQRQDRAVHRDADQRHDRGPIRRIFFSRIFQPPTYSAAADRRCPGRPRDQIGDAQPPLDQPPVVLEVIGSGTSLDSASSFQNRFEKPANDARCADRTPGLIPTKSTRTPGAMIAQPQRRPRRLQGNVQIASVAKIGKIADIETSFCLRPVGNSDDPGKCGNSGDASQGVSAMNWLMKEEPHPLQLRRSGSATRSKSWTGVRNALRAEAPAIDPEGQPNYV